jgi:hypothetical protein
MRQVTPAPGAEAPADAQNFKRRQSDAAARPAPERVNHLQPGHGRAASPSWLRRLPGLLLLQLGGIVETERQAELRAVGGNLSLLDPYVLGDHLGDPKVLKVCAGHVNRCLGCFLPRLRAAADNFNDFVSAVGHGCFRSSGFGFAVKLQKSTAWRGCCASLGGATAEWLVSVRFCLVMHQFLPELLRFG